VTSSDLILNQLHASEDWPTFKGNLLPLIGWTAGLTLIMGLVATVML
jgi:hypothetical protein